MHWDIATSATSLNTCHRRAHIQRQNRQRNIIWFNPPFSKNIAHSFCTHFPVGHKLHKILNRNTVKISYSFMSNIRSIIASHNTCIIRRSQSQHINTDNCNCRNKHACPLQNKCMSKDIVYKATVNRNTFKETSNTFKEWYRNHIKSFTHKKIFKRNGTFKTCLALKTKQNRSHHKMVNNEKIYFLHRRIKKM